MRGTDIVTVLNAIKDDHGNITGWKSTVLKNVHFERCTVIQTNTTAREHQRESLLMIWKGMVDADGLQCVCRAQLSQDKSNAFALENGDYILPGVCSDIPDVRKPLKDFLRTHDVLQITAVEQCLYGSIYLQHWEVKLG